MESETIVIKQHPCGTCVSCDCGPNPLTDEDGLCVSCGGVSLYIAKLCADGSGAVPPHVDPEMEGEQRERILEFIAEDGGPIDRSALEATVAAGASRLHLADLVWVAARIASMSGDAEDAEVGES